MTSITIDDVDGNQDDDAGTGSPVDPVGSGDLSCQRHHILTRRGPVINTEEGAIAVRFRIHVAPRLLGRVIGRRGRVAHAIRRWVGGGRPSTGSGPRRIDDD